MLSIDLPNYRSALTEICESCLVRDCFLPEKLLCGSKSTKKNDKQLSKNSITFLVSSRIGEVLYLGLRNFPVLKLSKCIQKCRDDLLSVISDHLRNSNVSITGT